jgi:hypothetical protein
VLFKIIRIIELMAKFLCPTNNQLLQVLVENTTSHNYIEELPCGHQGVKLSSGV